ncbi:MAG: hypothetical protein SFZ23_10855 [Planctomycetota bacterium]|nr:hypothetical protein [Planctomycetota bacterium]
MILRERVPLSPELRAALERTISTVPSVLPSMSLILILAGVGASVGAFLIVRQPDAGWLVALAVLLLVAGVAALVAGGVLMSGTLVIRRELARQRADVNAAFASGHVEALRIEASKVWRLPDVEIDAVLLLLHVGPDSFIVVNDFPEIDPGIRYLEAVPARFTAWFLPGESSSETARARWFDLGWPHLQQPSAPASEGGGPALPIDDTAWSLEESEASSALPTFKPLTTSELHPGVRSVVGRLTNEG